MAENEKKYVYRVEIDTMEDAKQLVAVSTKLQGRITLQSGNKFAVNAKSLLGVLSLGVAKGMTITLIADGSDEEAALDGLQRLAESGFAE